MGKSIKNGAKIGGKISVGTILLLLQRCSLVSAEAIRLIVPAYGNLTVSGLREITLDINRL